MAEAALKKLEEQLNCSICLDTYTDPKLLQCNHVYCQKCLVKLTVKDYQQGQLTLTCPICRQVTPVPANGVAGLQSAFHINHLLEIQDSFKRIKAPSVPQEGAVGGATSDPPSSNIIKHCLEHPDEELKLYCETCGDLICLKCAIKGGKHHTHEYELLHDAFEKYKGEIVSSLQPMEKQLSTVNEALVVLDTRCGEITNQQAVTEANIHKDIDQLQEILNIRRTKLIGDLHQVTQHKLKRLAVQKDQIETTQAQLSSCLHFMKESLKTSCEREVLMMKTNLVKQVKELTTTFQADELKPKTEADILFSASPDVVASCQNYGHVRTPGMPDPSKCHITGEIPEKLSVGERSSVTVEIISYMGQPCKEVFKSLECELVSEITSGKTKGSVERKSDHRYSISYQPTIKGRHQLHIKVEGQHIRGSPFNILATLQHNTPILTIRGVKSPIGVAVNQTGQVVVTEAEAHCVSIFNSIGERVWRFGTEGTGDGEFNKPRGVTVDDEGHILVADAYNHRIQKFSPSGDFLGRVGSKGTKPLQFMFPYAITFNTSNKKLYVVDDNDRVQVLNYDLTFYRTFGKKGSDNGQLNTPCGVACDTSGNVYVADTWNNRVQVFTAEGNFLRVFGQILMWPRGIAISSSGVVYVSEKDHQRVSVFTSEGRFVTSLGRSGSAPGQLNSPHGLAVDRNGLLYVCDVSNDCVQAFLCHK